MTWNLARMGLLGVLFLALWALAPAYATTTNIPDINTLLSQQTGDQSVKVFTSLLGSFFTSPFSAAGGSPGLIGGMFLIFNGCVFVVGMFWATYGIVGAIVETSETGEVLGKRISATWMPIRMVVGIGGIVPVFSGYSLAQVAIVTMTTIGIGIANLMWNGVVKDMDTFKAMASPGVTAAAQTGSIDYRAVARDLFSVHVCTLAVQDELNERNSHGIPLPITHQLKMFEEGLGQRKAHVMSGLVIQLNLCGRAVVQDIDKGSADDQRSFSVKTVNYAAFTNLTKQIAEVNAQQLLVLSRSVKAIAAKWYADRKAANATVNGDIVKLPDAALVTAGLTTAETVYNKATTIATSLKSSMGTALTDTAKTNMTKLGWIGAGSWFSTIAEVNASAVEAMRASEYRFHEPDLDSRHISQDTVNMVKAAMAAAEGKEVPGAGESDDSMWARLSAYIADAIGCMNPRTSTGNLSLGQAFIHCAVDFSKGSGGGDDLNPIIMFKNLGDRLIVAGEIFMVAGAFIDSDAGGKVADAVGQGKDSVVQKVAKTGKALAVKRFFGMLLSAFGEAAKALIKALVMLAPYFIVLGALMAIYLPMVPFITWMGALVQYCVIVCQGLVGAPIAALSHLDVEGEGMGRRTEPGYMFILNVTFRPALMLFGFMLATVLLNVIGSFEIDLFLSAMAGAQGNSLTGIVSFAGYLTVFFLLNLTLIQTLFNMIFLLPDQVLGLIGSAGHMTDMGKDTEGKAHNIFMAMGHGMRGALMQRPNTGPTKLPQPGIPGVPGAGGGKGGGKGGGAAIPKGKH